MGVVLDFGRWSFGWDPNGQLRVMCWEKGWLQVSYCAPGYQFCN